MINNLIAYKGATYIRDLTNDYIIFLIPVDLCPNTTIGMRVKGNIISNIALIKDKLLIILPSEAACQIKIENPSLL